MNNNPAPIAAVPMSKASTEAPPVLGSSPPLGIVERITPSLADGVLLPAVLLALLVVVFAPPEVSPVLGAPEVLAPLLVGSATGVPAVGLVPVVVLVPVFCVVAVVVLAVSVRPVVVPGVMALVVFVVPVVVPRGVLVVAVVSGVPGVGGRRWRRGLRLRAGDDFVGQLTALYDLAVEDVANDVDVEQVRSVGAAGVGGNDGDVAGIGRVCDVRYGRGTEAVVLYGRVLRIMYAHTATHRIRRVGVHLVVLYERLARLGNLAHPLEAYTGPTVVDHQVLMYPETIQMVGGVVAELVAPQAVALVVVDVGVSYLNLVDGLQARTDEPEEVRILGGVAQLNTLERAVCVGDARPIGARDVYRVEAGGIGRHAHGEP
jgi:hypothetical protein